VLVTGTAEFVAGRDRVWGFLVDPSRLGPCLPVPITRVDDRHYRASVHVGSGFFALNVGVDLEVADAVAERSIRIVARGGASGTNVEATTSFELSDGSTAGTTSVDYELDIRLTGMFAGQAEQLIEGRAPEAIERLLACIRDQIEG
jgi:carbon monoxide dehydrogenase subunit G